MKNKKENNKKLSNMDFWSDFTKKFDSGNGVTTAITTRESKDSKEVTVNSFFTNKLPKLKIGTREISVEVSSTEQEDQDLLHFLSKKVK